MPEHDQLARMLRKQFTVERDSYGHDLTSMTDEERVEFIRWNVLALENELHEMLQEVGWKPWATSRHINRDPAIGELVDAWHFFMNLLLAVGLVPAPTVSPSLVGDELFVKYMAKVRINEQRQRDGYDGVSGKCNVCHRDLAESDCTPTDCAYGEGDAA